MNHHVLGVSEASATAIWSVDAFARQIATTLAWQLAIAPDLTSLALIAYPSSNPSSDTPKWLDLPCNGDVAISLRPGRRLRTIFSLPLGRARLVTVWWWLRSGLREGWIMVRIVHECNQLAAEDIPRCPRQRAEFTNFHARLVKNQEWSCGSNRNAKNPAPLEICRGASSNHVILQQYQYVLPQGYQEF